MAKASWARRLRFALIMVWLVPVAAVEHVLIRLGLRPGLPVPVRHPDGSMTVHGIMHGFPVPEDAFSHHGWVPGLLTVHRDRVTHQPFSADDVFSFPREGMVVTVDWPGQGVLKRGASARIRVELPDGRVFRINLRAAYKEVVEDLAGRPLGRRAAGG
ncbi:hypothetical protein [Herbidospora mongoliensis]|uniref:hypothetical protein n=1 Tax=Herbidospora mongoliensis TaxID=688067 RepID=UPI0008356545|nr:hypothetical protein [Herbidospora mongoliensis]